MLKTVSKETEREEKKFRRNWFCETMSKRITDFDRFNMPTNHLMHIQNEIRGRERIFRFFFGVCVMFVWFFDAGFIDTVFQSQSSVTAAIEKSPTLRRIYLINACDVWKTNKQANKKSTDSICQRCVFG